MGDRASRSERTRLPRVKISSLLPRGEAGVVWVALALRLAAAIWARGFATLDDHFSVIEPAQAWVDGVWRPGPEHVPKRNLCYVGVHALLFWTLQRCGLGDPQGKMLVVRLIHALYSMITVRYGMRLADLLSPGAGRLAGWLLACFWAFPYLSVRNLVEYVCVPPLVLAAWWCARARGEGWKREACLAGLAAGFAFTLRYQTAPALLVLALFLRRPASMAAYVGCWGAVCVATLVIPEWVVLGSPLATVFKYVAHNVAHASDYVTNPWYTYLGTLLLVFVPPSSVLLLWGFARAWRRAGLVVWPVGAFLVAHSAIPNKQERFLAPIAAFVVVAAAVGVQGWEPKKVVRKLVGLAWRWFWGVNTLLLLMAVTTYGKRSRVEAMSFLRTRGPAEAIVVESHRTNPPRMPLFYAGSWPKVYTLGGKDSLEVLVHQMRGGPRPRYAILVGAKDLPRRVERLASVFPGMQLEEVVAPSLVDQLLFAANPRHNVNETVYVYRTGDGESG